MAFTANDMQIFSRRCQKFVEAFQGLREEAARLDVIYTNEALSGSEASWGDTAIATAAEHIDMINFFRDIKAFTENGTPTQLDRTQSLTPFLQAD